jgi:hypothetical protein
MDPERASWGIISIHSEESRFDYFRVADHIRNLTSY